MPDEPPVTRAARSTAQAYEQEPALVRRNTRLPSYELLLSPNAAAVKTAAVADDEARVEAWLD
jgi:hypothetical protein